MNKKGFTLVELLAIIAIIAVIALITTPLVIKVVENGKKNSFLDSVNGIIRVVELDNSKNDYVAGSYQITNGVVTNLTTNEVVRSEGGADENGTMSIDERGNITYAIHNNNWCVIYDSSKNKTVQEYQGSCSL